MVQLADTSREQVHWDAGRRIVLGIDEVGRGPLAGAAVIGAVALDPQRPIAGLRDSKKCSRRQIEQLSQLIYDNAALVSIGAASPGEIDELGIVAALELAMRRALARIERVDAIISDGLPFAELRDRGLPYESVVRGDAQVASIAAASIVAKQMRDRLMQRLALRHPAYGWERNVGYGTAQHMAAIREHGLSTHHRRSFCRSLIEVPSAA